MSCFLISLLISCAVQRHNEGNVKMQGFHLNKPTNKRSHLFCVDDKQLWYRDSTMVQEIIICSSEDSFGVRKEWTEISHYIFCDFRTLSFYEYFHFSDTAKLRTSYKSPNDTSKQLFYPFHRQGITKNMMHNGKWLEDTMMGGKPLGRYRFDYHGINNKGPYIVPYTLYTDCNQSIKGDYAHFFKEFSEERHCPVVEFNWGDYPIVEGYKLVKVSNALTKEQRKVFDAWEKYAKEHPVK